MIYINRTTEKMESAKPPNFPKTLTIGIRHFNEDDVDITKIMVNYRKINTEGDLAGIEMSGVKGLKNEVRKHYSGWMFGNNISLNVVKKSLS